MRTDAKNEELLRVAKASAVWAWDHFGREAISEALGEEGTDLLEVRSFYTIGVANYSSDEPLLQDPPLDV